MIDFVGTCPSLRKALWVAMATMHFHVAQKRFIYGHFFLIQGVPGNNWAPSKNCTWGARLVRLDPGVVGLRSKSVYL